MIIRIGQKRTIHIASMLATDYAYEADVTVKNEDGGSVCMGTVRHRHDEQVDLCLGDNHLPIDNIRLEGTEPEEMLPEINRLRLPLKELYTYHKKAAIERQRNFRNAVLMHAGGARRQRTGPVPLID